MFPLYDESRAYRHKTPVITIGLIFFNTLIFFFSLPALEGAINDFVMVPQDILLGENLETIFSSMFLHGGFLHLIGNMWFLWIFGDNLERTMGRFRFLIFYLLCGLLASLIYCFFTTDKAVPTIGASGAISGVLGGYLVVHPKNKIKALVPLGFFLTIASIPAIIFLFIWLFYQFLLPEPGVATGAHIAGFFAGILLVNFFKKKI